MSRDRDALAMSADELLAFMDAAFERELTWRIESLDAGHVTVRQPTSGGDLRPGGTVSGPTLMGLADGAAYLMVLARIGPQALAVTSNLNINFLRRPRPGDLLARATLLKLGRTLALVEVAISSDGHPDPMAHAVVTYSLALVDGTGPDAHQNGAPT